MAAVTQHPTYSRLSKLASELTDGWRYSLTVAKRSKKPADLNRLAAAIVSEATDETSPEPESQHVQAGRLGGQKGGKRRAAQMSAEERSAAAKRAAQARWSPKP
jgi:hypothetical protein